MKGVCSQFGSDPPAVLSDNSLITADRRVVSNNYLGGPALFLFVGGGVATGSMLAFPFQFSLADKIER